MEFSPKTIAEIEKLYKGRHHVELSIGVLKDGEITYTHWNPDREADDRLLIYPVGSICKPFTASLLAVGEGGYRRPGGRAELRRRRRGQLRPRQRRADRVLDLEK